MKLMRVGPKGAEKPAMLDAGGVIRDISAHVADIDGSVLGADGLAKLAGIDLGSCPAVDAGTRIGACVGNVRNVICVGLNYTDHAIETNNPIPTEPVLFSKAVTSLSGPNDRCREAPRVDHDGLGDRAGNRHRQAREIRLGGGRDGLCRGLRGVQRRLGARVPDPASGWPMAQGKSHETFGPLGPWMVTKDEIADPSNLAMELKVNGNSMQKGSTKTFIFHPATVVSHISQYLTLEPGDVIPTGTPPGVVPA